MSRPRALGRGWVWLGVGAGVGLLVAAAASSEDSTPSSTPSSTDPPKPWPDAAPWEVDASAAGDVDPGHGLEPEPVTPVASGSPADFCGPMPKLGGTGDEAPAPETCVLDPATHPDHAPAWRGAPLASSPSSSTWPVLTKHSQRLVVSYWGPSGVRGHSGRAFGSLRHDEDGTERRHAGVDLFADEGDVVVAPEDGHVLAILPFHSGSWALYLRSMLGDRVVNLGEIAARSWREFGIAKGDQVIQGQPLARVAKMNKGSTMLHIEIASVPELASDEALEQEIRERGWAWLEADPPAILRDPSGYLLTAAHRTWQREQLFA